MQQVNASPDLTVRSVYFANTSGSTVTMQEGEPVAYDLDDTNAPVSNTADPKNQRGRRAVSPATAVLGAFAGVVSNASAGKVIVAGAGSFIDIIVPRKGDVLKVLAKVSSTKGSTILGITNAGGRNFVSPADATFNVDAVAIALETLDTSTTAGLTLAKFL